MSHSSTQPSSRRRSPVSARTGLVAVLLTVIACAGSDKATGPEPSSNVTGGTPVAGLVAYYRFDGNADDASGKASNGVVSGATPTVDRFGNANRAFFFDGVSASIATTTRHFTQTNQLTVSLWANAPSQGLSYFMMSGDFGIFWEQSSVGLAISHPRTNSASGPAGTAGWVHFVGTFDGDTIKAYVNGQLAGSTFWPGALSTPDRPLVFGQFLSQYWRGALDDVRIYDRVLSTDEIQQLLHEGGWTPHSTPVAGPTTYELSGVITDDAGRAVPGAMLNVHFVPAEAPSATWCNCESNTTTDATGHYRIVFTAVADGMSANGYRQTALVRVAAGGAVNYEPDNQWFEPTTADSAQTLDFHLHVLQQIASGDSILVTVDPTDSFCSNDIQDMWSLPPSYVCRTILVMPAANGVLSVWADSIDGRAPPQLEMEDGIRELIGYPGSMQVTGGQAVAVNVEILRGSTQSTFLVHTTLVRQ